MKTFLKRLFCQHIWRDVWTEFYLRSLSHEELDRVGDLMDRRWWKYQCVNCGKIIYRRPVNQKNLETQPKE
jgi:hypothetical protein